MTQYEQKKAKRNRRQSKVRKSQQQLFGRDLLEKQYNLLKQMEKGNELQRIKTMKSMSVVLSDDSGDSNEDTQMQIEKMKQQRASKGSMALLNKLLIKRDSSLKGAFDILMLIVSVYNIYGNAYYSAFEIPFKNDLWFILFDNIIELLFFIDMCCCFFQ